jgi:hypothetical protein
VIWDTISKGKNNYINAEEFFFLSIPSREKIVKNYFNSFLDTYLSSSNIEKQNLYFLSFYIEKIHSYEICCFYNKNKSFSTHLDTISYHLEQQKNTNMICVVLKEFYCVWFENRFLLIKENKNYNRLDIQKYVEFVFSSHDVVFYFDYKIKKSIYKKYLSYQSISKNHNKIILMVGVLILLNFSFYFINHKKDTIQPIPKQIDKIDTQVLQNQNKIKKLNLIINELLQNKIRVIKVEYKKRYKFVVVAQKNNFIKFLNDTKYKIKIIKTLIHDKKYEVEFIIV